MQASSGPPAQTRRLFHRDLNLNAKACFDKFFLFASPGPNKPKSQLAYPIGPV